jgi:peptidoglycan hydrolase CwlO-like protein
LRTDLAARDALLNAQEEQIRDLNQKRQDVTKRLDQLIEELDRLDEELDDRGAGAAR